MTPPKELRAVASGLLEMLGTPVCAVPGLVAAGRHFSVDPPKRKLLVWSILLGVSAEAVRNLGLPFLFPNLTRTTAQWLVRNFIVSLVGFILVSTALGAALRLSVRLPARRAFAAGAFGWITGELLWLTVLLILVAAQHLLGPA